MMPLELEALTQRIIGAAIEVHRSLGPGFLESIYETALEIELAKRGLKVDRQLAVTVYYDDQPVGLHRLDMLVEGLVVLELKAVKELDPVFFATVRSYLKAMHLKRGLLLNFNT
ncbi:MAG: GxxExxY protein [Phycisphaeraceae bacterium]